MQLSLFCLDFILLLLRHLLSTWHCVLLSADVQAKCNHGAIITCMVRRCSCGLQDFPEVSCDVGFTGIYRWSQYFVPWLWFASSNKTCSNVLPHRQVPDLLHIRNGLGTHLETIFLLRGLATQCEPHFFDVSKIAAVFFLITH